MLANTEQIAAAALALPEEERAELADRLTESLDGPPDVDVEQAWADEIAHRLEEVRSGKAEMVPWEEARHQIFGDEHGKAG